REDEHQRGHAERARAVVRRRHPRALRGDDVVHGEGHGGGGERHVGAPAQVHRRGAGRDARRVGLGVVHDEQGLLAHLVGAHETHEVEVEIGVGGRRALRGCPGSVPVVQPGVALHGRVGCVEEVGPVRVVAAEERHVVEA
ncbi:MAG: hypothetical protein ACK559_38440, partial [bacterium]